jgi:hypothetical protein
MSNSEQPSGLLKQIVITKDPFLVLQRQWTWLSNKRIRYSGQWAISAGPTFREPTLFDLGILVEEVMGHNAKQQNGRLGPNCLAGIRYSKTA